MRCGCPHCQAFMVQEEDRSTCVCPECGYRCDACLGTGTAITREQLTALRNTAWFAPSFDGSPDDPAFSEHGFTTQESPDAPSGF